MEPSYTHKNGRALFRTETPGTPTHTHTHTHNPYVKAENGVDHQGALRDVNAAKEDAAKGSSPK